MTLLTDAMISPVDSILAAGCAARLPPDSMPPEARPPRPAGSIHLIHSTAFFR